MVILNNEQVYEYHQIISFLPKRIRKYVANVRLDEVEEIRLRKAKPVMLYIKGEGYYLSEKGSISKTAKNNIQVNEEDINQAVELISKNSLFAVEDSLKNGYITIPPGHRIGVCGSAVLRGGSIYTIKNISGLNYRLSREIFGAADGIIDSVVKNKEVLNTLIISPPGCGKTTLLRDLIRQISNMGFKVSVADERNEISGMYNGFFGFDLGESSDVLEGAKKSEAMKILLRSMGPQVIATDEIGTQEDLAVIKEAICSGVSVITTIHSKDRSQLMKKHEELAKLFDCFITLSHNNGPGTVEEIYCAG